MPEAHHDGRERDETDQRRGGQRGAGAQQLGQNTDDHRADRQSPDARAQHTERDPPL